MKRKIAYREIVKRFAVITGLIFLCCWYPVLQIFYFNRAEFSFTFGDLFAVTALIALLTAVLISPLLFSPKVYRGLRLILVAILGIGVFNFLLPWHASPMDAMSDPSGSPIPMNRSFYVFMGGIVLVSTSAWLIHRYCPTMKTTARLCAQLLVVYVLLFTIWAAATASLYPKALLANANQDHKLWRLSDKENIILVVFDGIQGSTVRGYLQENPHVKAALDGFVFYPWAASTYPNTRHSIKSLLIGHSVETSSTKWFKFKKPNGRLLVSLHDKGYDTRTNIGRGACKYCYAKRDPSFLSNFIDLWYLGYGYGYGVNVRSLPGLQWLVPGVPLSLSPVLQQHRHLIDLHRFEDAIDSLWVDESLDKAFILAYFSGTHEPFLYTQNCTPRRTSVSEHFYSFEGLHANLACAFSLFERFLDRLKQLGVYDESVVYLLSDHGWSGVNGQPRTARTRKYFPATSGVQGQRNIKFVGDYNPLLMFKDLHSTAGFQINDDPASLIDVHETICARTGACDRTQEAYSLRDDIPEDRKRWYWRYFGGQKHRFDGDFDRYHEGLDKWWEQRSYRGGLYTELAASIIGYPDPVALQPEDTVGFQRGDVGYQLRSYGWAGNWTSGSSAGLIVPLQRKVQLPVAVSLTISANSAITEPRKIALLLNRSRKKTIELSPGSITQTVRFTGVSNFVNTLEVLLSPTDGNEANNHGKDVEFRVQLRRLSIQ